MALGELLAEISAHLEDAAEERFGENGKRTSVAIRRAFTSSNKTINRHRSGSMESSGTLNNSFKSYQDGLEF